MSKYKLYHSAEDQCYTLVGEINQKNLLEDDAELVKTIEAQDWDSAVEIRNKFIEGENNG